MRHSKGTPRTIVWCRTTYDDSFHAFQTCLWEKQPKGTGHALCSHMTLGCVELWTAPGHWPNVKHCKDCLSVLRMAIRDIPFREILGEPQKMSTKSTHRRLQRLVEEELGKRPKLQFCMRLLQENPKKEGETSELWIARVYVDHKDKLLESALRKEAEDGS